LPSWLWGSEAFPLELISFYLDINCFTQLQFSDMAHLLGANERQSFVVYSLIIYDYDNDTEDDRFFGYLTYDILSHSNFDKIKLYLNDEEYK
jgi:hypothetical protein